MPPPFLKLYLSFSLFFFFSLGKPGALPAPTLSMHSGHKQPNKTIRKFTGILANTCAAPSFLKLYLPFSYFLIFFFRETGCPSYPLPSPCIRTTINQTKDKKTNKNNQNSPADCPCRESRFCGRGSGSGRPCASP